MITFITLNLSGYWSGGFCPKGAHCPFRANHTNSTAFAAFHFGLDGMAVEFVDSNGGVLWTSPVLPRRRKSEVTPTKSDDAVAVRVDRSDVFLPGDGGCVAFRIPALVSTGDVLLAFAECRKWAKHTKHQSRRASGSARTGPRGCATQQ